MKRVTGIGGVFFKCKDPDLMQSWYRKHLDINADHYSAMFQWKECDDKEACTVWSLFKEDTTYFNPGNQSFMINYRVYDLEKLLVQLREEGVEIVGDMETYDYGKFAWIIDPEGNKIELWQPL